MYVLEADGFASLIIVLQRDKLCISLFSCVFVPVFFSFPPLFFLVLTREMSLLFSPFFLFAPRFQ